VKILEMVVGEVRTKWVSPRIAGFVVTYRFTPRVGFRLWIACDCGNFSGAVLRLPRSPMVSLLRARRKANSENRLAGPELAGLLPVQEFPSRAGEFHSDNL
jgi:hypothetical protein